MFGKDRKINEIRGELNVLRTEFSSVKAGFEALKTSVLEASNRVEILRADFHRVIDAAATSQRSLQNTINRLRRNNKEEEPNIERRLIDHILPKKTGIMGRARTAYEQ